MIYKTKQIRRASSSFSSLILGLTTASASAAVLNFDGNDLITAGKFSGPSPNFHGFSFESYSDAAGATGPSQIYSGTSGGALDLGVSVNGFRQSGSQLFPTDLPIYDTNFADLTGNNGADTDLQRNIAGGRQGWAGGNLGTVSPNFDAGGAVIVPTNNSRDGQNAGGAPGDFASATGNFSDPNDHASGGLIVFDIANTVDYRFFGFDVVDYEEPEGLSIATKGRGMTPDRTFMITQNSVEIFEGFFNTDPNDFISSEARFFSGVDGGISRLVGQFDGGGNIDQLAISFNSVSGGVGRLELSPAQLTTVPEVSSIVPLFGLFISCAAFRRRVK